MASFDWRQSLSVSGWCSADEMILNTTRPWWVLRQPPNPATGRQPSRPWPRQQLADPVTALAPAPRRSQLELRLTSAKCLAYLMMHDDLIIFKSLKPNQAASSQSRHSCCLDFGLGICRKIRNRVCSKAIKKHKLLRSKKVEVLQAPDKH